ncbi:hypothetical protein [Kineococcus xinjiangensis]|uniref:hypothetical protein n=1 Tax=Kineococcus xinjiangensis TaxID=512762 RepID=UPI0011B01EDB|nr:hypothetical protein [Kineococcus xinjiangensis]
MDLKPYADLPGMRARQLLGDACCLLWVLASCWAGVLAHRVVSSLAEPALHVAEGAGGLADQLRDAAGTVGRIPLAGRELEGALSGAASRADSVAAAGQQQAELVADVALLSALAVALVPSVLALALRVPRRLRYARRAAAAEALARRGGAELLALRALVGSPPEALARVGADPLAGWRAGDPQVVCALAALELRRLGLHSPLS